MTRRPLSRSLRGLCTAPRAWRRGPLVHGFLHTAKDVNWGDYSSPAEDVRHAIRVRGLCGGLGPMYGTAGRRVAARR